MTNVPWADLEPGRVERLVSALLVRTVHGAMAVDGAGGDDGADVTAPADDGGQHVYEIKSFHRRLTRGQQGQIEKSLATATRRHPDMIAWTLVLPLDQSPAEGRWLAGLQAATTVRLDWMGRTQLEAAFAEHPHLARAFLPGSAERRALELLSDLRHEEAGLTAGVPDAVERGAKVRALLGQVDPDYDFDLQLGASATTITVHPRDVDAMTRRPLRGHMRLAVPVGAEQADALESFALYGTPLELSAEHIESVSMELPGGLDALLDGAVPQAVSIGASTSEPRRARLTGTAGSRVHTRVNVVIREVTTGPAGGIRLAIGDDANVLDLQMLIPPQGPGEIHFRCTPTGTLPDDALPAVRFVHDLAGCDMLRLESAGDKPVSIRLPDVSGVNTELTAAIIEVLEALLLVQDACGQSFAMPQRLTVQEHRELMFGAALLRGEQASWPFPGMLARATPEAVRRVLETGLLPRVTMDGSGSAFTCHVGEHSLTLPISLQMHAQDLLVVNTRQLCLWVASHPPSSATIHLDVEADELSRITFSAVQTAAN